MKTCTVCLAEKKITDFPYHKRNKRFLARCKECQSKQQKQYYRDTRDERRRKAKIKRLENPLDGTNRQLLNNYGITLEDKNKMVAKQHNKCLICNKEFVSTRDTHVDHCHVSGKIRGILCGKCNQMLGGSRDSVEILANGIKYLNERGYND